MRHQLPLLPRIAFYIRRYLREESSQEFAGALALTAIFGWIGWAILENLSR